MVNDDLGNARNRLVQVLNFVELNKVVSVTDISLSFRINWRTAKSDLELLVSLGLIEKAKGKYKVLDDFYSLVDQEVGR